MNYLARNIGIWYQKQEWVNDLKREIVKHLPPESIKSVFKDKIVLVDNSTIEFIETSDHSRGKKLSESYIQSGIGFDCFAEVIAPCTQFGTNRCFLIYKYEDFEKPVSIKKYFQKHFFSGY